MKIAITEVNGCRDCPHYNQEDTCYEADRELEWDRSTSSPVHPDWCPLLDLEGYANRWWQFVKWFPVGIGFNPEFSGDLKLGISHLLRIEDNE